MKQLLVRIREELNHSLTEVAELEDRSKNKTIERAIKAYVEQSKRESTDSGKAA